MTEQIKKKIESLVEDLNDTEDFEVSSIVKISKPLRRLDTAIRKDLDPVSKEYFEVSQAIGGLKINFGKHKGKN